MTTYLFGNNFSNTPIEKSFKSDVEAFEYANGMTDGPDCVPVWKQIGNHWYGFIQNGLNDEGKWILDEQVTFPVKSVDIH